MPCYNDDFGPPPDRPISKKLDGIFLCKLCKELSIEKMKELMHEEYSLYEWYRFHLKYDLEIELVCIDGNKRDEKYIESLLNEFNRLLIDPMTLWDWCPPSYKERIIKELNLFK